MAFRSCAIALMLWAGLLTAQVSPAPARQSSGAGDPVTLSLPCDGTLASIGAGTLYLDTVPAHVGKRMWLCATADGVNFAWQALGSNVAASTQPVVTNTFALVGSSYPGSVADARAAVGMTVSMEVIGNPGGVFIAAAWIDTAGTISYTITNLGVANAKLQNARFALYMHAP